MAPERRESKEVTPGQESRAALLSQEPEREVREAETAAGQEEEL